MCIILACVLSAWSIPTRALDAALDVSQYGHTAWRIRDGFPKGRIFAFAQTPDGYLWIGTEFGLVRFDGVRAVPWQSPGGASLPHPVVTNLLAARDGTLWIGTRRGLASWKAGKFTVHTGFESAAIGGIAEDRDGTVWVAAQKSNVVALLCAVRSGRTECQGEDESLGKAFALYQDRHGRVWAAAPDRVWDTEAAAAYSFPSPVSGAYQNLSETAAGAILVATQNGLMQIVGDKVDAYPLSPMRAPPLVMLRDRDGALWIGTAGGGLLHVDHGKSDTFARADGLSGDLVARLFEDREGNVWVATYEGLDRFRALAAATYSVKQGISGYVASVIAARDGSVWLSTQAGLKRWRDGRFEDVVARGRPARASGSLFEDRHGRIWLGSVSGLAYVENAALTYVDRVPAGYIDAIAEDALGTLWIAHEDAGLIRLSPDREVETLPWTKINNRGAASRLAVDPVRGGVWLAYTSGGLIHFADDQVAASYSVREGLGSGRVNQVSVDADGTVWAATDGGLSRIKDGRIATLDISAGLPCDTVHSIIHDDDGAMWLYSACGLVRIARPDLDAWTAAADTSGAPHRISARLLDESDGFRRYATLTSWSPGVARSQDGKLWFAEQDGLTRFDPRRVWSNKLPPPVFVESITADRKAYAPSSNVRLPPMVRDLQIDYTALSFVAPEKVLFRYKLEGRDRDWQDAGNRRQAYYTDLDPGNYRFRVIASNNSGVWNEQGATLDFSIAPAYWQTNWFRASCVAALIVLLWTLYRLRLRQMKRQFDMTLDARVNERTRIARDLHDTLLQSFHGLLLRFQTAFELLPARPSEAKQLLGSTIDQAAEAITEGRDAVQGLRSSTMETNDLADAIRTLGEQLAADEGAHQDVVLRFESQGAPRALHPIVRDEIFRIAGEALRNALRHAGAKQIEVELRYDASQLQLRVRDDGKGIDAEILRRGGREGHFGMHGMRERAALIGGKLTLWSALDSGTEVELNIPALHAYAPSSSDRRSVSAEKRHDQNTAIDS